MRFVSEKSLLKLNNFYHAFGLPFRSEILKRAAFRESVVFAYTSTEESMYGLWFSYDDIIITIRAVINLPTESVETANGVILFCDITLLVSIRDFQYI